MAQAEIHYIVTDAETHQGDVEKVFVAIGAYQDEVPYHVPQTAEIDQKGESVEMKLIRTVRGVDHYGLVQHAAEVMRQGVEKHFSDEDRERLSGYFAGTAISASELNRE